VAAIFKEDLVSSIWGAIYQATFGAYQSWRDGRTRKAQAQRDEAMLDRVMAKGGKADAAEPSDRGGEKTGTPGH
jgi:hypothetical protein